MNDSGLRPGRLAAPAELHDYFEYQSQPYLAALRDVFVFGYVTSTDLHHINPTTYPSLRTSDRYLAELKRLGLVNSKPRKMYHEPLIFYPTSRGITYLKTRKNRFDVFTHRHEVVRPAELAHALAVTRVMTSVNSYVRTEPSLQMVDLDRRLFHAHNRMSFTAPEDGYKKSRRLVPDFKALLLRQRGSLRFPFQFYFEVEMGTHDMRKVRGKVESYQRWYEQGGARELAELYKQTTNLVRAAVTYRLVFVVQDRRGNDFRALSRYATHIRRVSPRPPVYATTFENIRNARESQSYALWYLIESLSDPVGRSERARYDDMEAQLRKVRPIALNQIQIDSRADRMAG